MKTLVIAPQPFFSPRGTPLSVYYRTLIGAELQLDIDFLTYGQGQDVDIPGVRFYRTPSFSWLGQVKIGPSALKLFHDIFIFAWMLYLLTRHRYALVHAHEEAVFLALLLKPIFRFKLVYDMHSSLPQQLSNFNYTSNKIIVNTFERLEIKSLEKSEAIITICPDLYHYVNKVLPGNQKNTLIENSILEPVRLKQQHRRGVGSPAMDQDTPIPTTFKTLVVYAGTLEHYQGIDLLVNAIVHVVAEDATIGFIIVGGTVEQVTRFSKQANSLGVQDNVIFTGQVPQVVARAYSQQADILVSPRSSGTNTPLKIYEQLASGKPLVATAIYSHTQVLTEEVAFLVNLDARDLASGIIAATGPDAEKRAARAKELYEREYARPIYVEKLKKVLEMVS
jgi:glycosyltransferase involved in cell wall biosynthesis